MGWRPCGYSNNYICHETTSQPSSIARPADHRPLPMRRPVLATVQYRRAYPCRIYATPPSAHVNCGGTLLTKPGPTARASYIHARSGRGQADSHRTRIDPVRGAGSPHPITPPVPRPYPATDAVEESRWPSGAPRSRRCSRGHPPPRLAGTPSLPSRRQSSGAPPGT
jgi:hypothetical protein